jgi:hypothetical protein
MSFFAYARFLTPSLTVKKGNVDCKPDADLPKIGQHDGVAEKEQNPDYKASAGWFRVIQWEYGAGANVEVSAGVSVGNVTDTVCTILKYTGENTAIAYRAMFNRAPFDLEIHITERLGQGQNKMNCKLIFKGAVMRKVRSSTGIPGTALVDVGGHSAGTSIQASDTDTKELDVYELVYQKLDINTFGKETHVSTHGATT